MELSFEINLISPIWDLAIVFFLAQLGFLFS